MVLKALRITLLAVILLIVAALALMQVKEVKLYLFSKVAEIVKEESGLTVTVGDLELMLPFEVKAAQLRVSDGSGNSLEACRAIIRVAPRALFDRKLHIHSVNLTGVTILHREGGGGALRGGAIAPLDFTKIPFFLSIPQIYLMDLSVDSSTLPELAGRELDGEASLLINPHSRAMEVKFSLSDRGLCNCFLSGELSIGERGENLFVDALVRGEGGAFIGAPELIAFAGKAHFLSERRTWESFFSGEPSEGRIIGEASIRAKRGRERLLEAKGNLYITPQKGLMVEDVEGEIGGALLGGRLLYSRDHKLDGTQFTLLSKDLSHYGEWLGADLKGEGVAAFELYGDFMTPAFSLTFNSDNLGLQQASFSKVGVELEGALLKNRSAEAALSIAAEERGKGPLSIRSNLHYTPEGLLKIDNIAFKLPDISVEGGLLYSPSKGLIGGSLAGRVDDLSQLDKFFNNRFSGSMEFSASLLCDEKESYFLEILLSSKSGAVDQLSLEGLRIEASIADIYSHPDGYIDIAAKRAAAAGVEVDNFRLSNHIDGDERVWPLSLAGEVRGFAAKGEGYWSLREEGLSLTVDELSGERGQEAFHLEAPFTLTAGGGKSSLRDCIGTTFASWLRRSPGVGRSETTQYCNMGPFPIAQPRELSRSQDAKVVPIQSLTPLLLSFGEGQLAASFMVDEEGRMESSLKLVDLPLSLFTSEIYSQPIDGRVTAAIALSGSGEKLLGDAYLDFSALSFALGDRFRGASPTRASIKAEFSPTKTTFKGMLYGVGATPIDIEASLPITLAPRAPLLIVDCGGDMALSLKASGSLTPIFEIIAAEDFIFSGDGEVEIDLRGPLLSPTVSGRAALVNGSLESYPFGTYLSDIKASFSGEGNRLLITGLTARDQSNGRIEGKGEVSLLGEKGYPFSIDFTLSNLELFRLDNGSASFDGKLSIAGKRERVEIGGEITAKKMNYRIAKKIEEVREAVEVSYINQDPEKPAPTIVGKKRQAAIDTKLDLLVKIPQGLLKVNDEGLNSAWGGEISLKGSIDKPKVKGEIKLTSGEYFLNGQPYDLTNGSVVMRGNMDKKSSIYVVASREINDYRVEVIVQGKIANPNIILRSNPPLPQQEILSLILFGAAPAEISHTQDRQLERSLSSLTKNKGGGGAFDKLQKSVGIDRIDIHRHQLENREEVSIKIGKYLTKDLFISLNKGLGNEPTRIGLEAKLQKNLKVQVDAGESPRSSDSRTSGQVSLIWKRDY